MYFCCVWWPYLNRLALGIFLYVYYNSQPGCKQQNHPLVLTIALTGLLIYNGAGLTSAVVCTITSLLGSLIRPKPRRPVIGILHFQIHLYLVEFPWLIYSTYVCFNPSLHRSDECKAFNNAVKMYYAAVGLSWVVFLVIVTALAIDIDPCGCCSVINIWTSLQKEISEENLEKKKTGNAKKNWPFCNVCSCCRNPLTLISTRTAMADAVRAMGVIFQDFDSTISDLLAGYVLVGLHQRRLYYQGKSPESELNQVRSDWP